MELFDILLKQARRDRRYFRNRGVYLRKIKHLARKWLPDAKVYLFGSVARNDFWIGSDIDVLIMSRSMPRSGLMRSKIRAGIRNAIGFVSPFELHLVTPKEMEWYDRFIDKKIRI